MTGTERLVEIGAILARGLIRLRTRQREAEAWRSGESPLDFPADQSVHAKNRRGRENT
jgi:hypothetical protein